MQSDNTIAYNYSSVADPKFCVIMGAAMHNFNIMNHDSGS